MKALTYHGAQDVRVENVPDPTLVDSTDVILRVTSTAICGSDLHLYRGKVPGMEQGDILGHEFMGIVEEVGRDVRKLKAGDRVVVPFTISCGACYFCARGLFSACENTNPGKGGLVMNGKQTRTGAGMFGYTHLYGGYAGGQAEFVRVPHADIGPLVVPDDIEDAKLLFLSDILPTAYQAVVNAKVGEGSLVAVFGAGPVGLLAMACARMLGAARVFAIDHHAYRLDFARATYGAETIDFDDVSDPAEVILNATSGRGVDAAIDAVGFEAKGSAVDTVLTALKVEASSGSALRQAIACVRRGGSVAIPGLYSGYLHAFMLGDAFEKGLNFTMGQTNVQQHMPLLLQRILDGDVDPAAIITHPMSLEDAARGYTMFDQKEDQCRKVVLRPFSN